MTQRSDQLNSHLQPSPCINFAMSVSTSGYLSVVVSDRLINVYRGDEIQFVRQIKLDSLIKQVSLIKDWRRACLIDLDTTTEVICFGVVQHLPASNEKNFSILHSVPDSELRTTKITELKLAHSFASHEMNPLLTVFNPNEIVFVD